MSNIHENMESIKPSINLYDVFISYARTDGAGIADCLCRALESNNISVWFDMNSLRHGDYRKEIKKALSSSQLFVVILTQGSLESEWANKEIEYALSEAKERGKSIVPVLVEPLDFSSPQIPHQLKYWNGFMYKPGDNRVINHIADKITKWLNAEAAAVDLHEKLAEYLNAGLNDKATECLCDMTMQICNELEEKVSNNDARESKYLTLLSYLERISDLYDYTYSQAEKKLAHKKLSTIDRVDSLLHTDFFCSDDLYRLSIALRLLYLDREIRLDCADAITNGDVSEGIVNTLPESDYAEKQKIYAEKYAKQININKIRNPRGSPDLSYAQEKFIIDTNNYIYKNDRKAKDSRVIEGVSTLDDELLCSVASFTQEGNKLFDILSERQPAGDFLQCLLMSYERLKAYCEVIGEKSICAECIDRITELKRKINKPAKEAFVSDKIEKSIKTLLGLTLPKSGNYDVFISHKKEDYDLALDIYEFARKNLKEPFFDRFTLPELSEAQYRKSIMQALDVSKHFVVVFSDLDYLKSDWVSLEMEIFQSEKDEGRKPDSNFLMIATNKVYKEIIASNKTLIPIEYRRGEIICFEEYKNVLLNYLNR